MSEQVKPPCVRGCTDPVINPDTRVREGTAPRPASCGLLCARCATVLRSGLRQIPDLYAMLDVRPSHAGNPYGAGGHGTVSGSPSLIRLDVLLVQDPRTTAAARFHEDGDETALPGDVPSLVLSWCECFADAMRVSARSRPADLTAGVRFLTGAWYENLCHQPWIDLMWAEIGTIIGTLRRLTGTRPPRALGTCGCAATLYEPDPGSAPSDGGTIIECRSCGHRLNALAVIRLADAQRLVGECRG